MSPKQTPQNQTGFNLNGAIRQNGSAIFLKIIAGLLSRMMLTALFFVLLFPLMIILSSFNADIFPAILIAVMFVLFWPIAITGRTEITEKDIEFVVGSWIVALTLIGALLQFFKVHVGVRFRFLFAAVVAFFLVATVSTIYFIDADDKAIVFTILGIAFVISQGILLALWGIRALVKWLSTPTKG